MKIESNKIIEWNKSWTKKEQKTNEWSNNNNNKQTTIIIIHDNNWQTSITHNINKSWVSLLKQVEMWPSNIAQS